MSILSEGLSVAAASWTALGGMPILGAGVTLDLDRTFVLQMVLFMALIVVLKPLLFDPMLRVFEQREQRTEGARAEARSMQERAGDLLRRYDREVDRMKQSVMEQRDQLRHETARLESDVLEQARDATHRILDEGRKRIDEEVRKLEVELDRSTPELAARIASSVLGREAR